MPHQAHLSQAGGVVPYPRRERGPSARPTGLTSAGSLAGRRQRWPRLLQLIFLWLALWACLPSVAVASPDCQPVLESVMVARETARDGQRPTEGWEPTQLPDLWGARWPDYHGPLWYRLDWRSTCPGQTVALSIARIVMAGQLFLNDDLLWQDAHLTEPLSRSWNMSRYWLLPAAALKAHNTLWLRVVAPEYTRAGLGPVALGLPGPVFAAHRDHLWQQRGFFVLNLTLSLLMAGLFGVFWLLRREERAFGWFALASVLWSVWIANILVTSPWPYSSTDSWERQNLIAFMLYICAFCMFTWSFGSIAVPRLVRVLWGGTFVMILTVAFVPASVLPKFYPGLLFAYAAIFSANCLQFIVHACRTRRRYDLLLAACLVFFLLICVHDVLQLQQIIESQSSFSPASAPLISLFMFLILAWRYAGSLKRIEAFNDELRTAVARTRDELTSTLNREHDLEADNIRLNERLRLTHDLHDSLGSSLMHSMAMVGQSNKLGGEQFLSILRELRNDLRHVIDGSSASMAESNGTPAQWIAPLRRRFTGLSDDLGIDSTWQLPESWPVDLTTTQLQGLTRFLEEALTNLLKHGEASHLWVLMCALPGGGGLLLRVIDDGHGFDVDAVREAGTGIGMNSMFRRIERIHGCLSITSQPGQTMLAACVYPEPQ